MKTTVEKQPGFRHWIPARQTRICDFRRYDGSRECRTKEPKIEMRLPWGRWVTWYGWGKGWSKAEVSPGRGVSELGVFGGIG